MIRKYPPCVISYLKNFILIYLFNFNSDYMMCSYYMIKIDEDFVPLTNITRRKFFTSLDFNFENGYNGSTS